MGKGEGKSGLDGKNKRVGARLGKHRSLNSEETCGRLVMSYQFEEETFLLPFYSATNSLLSVDSWKYFGPGGIFDYEHEPHGPRVRIGVMIKFHRARQLRNGWRRPDIHATL